MPRRGGYGEWKDWWEFPGGKIELGEDELHYVNWLPADKDILEKIVSLIS